MTPEEKASELMRKFRDDNYFTEKDRFEVARNNSLIVADEVLNAYCGINIIITLDNIVYLEVIFFWKLVKQYLQELKTFEF